MVYYIETNLIAIIIGVVLLIQGKRNSSRNETSQMIMDGMLRILVMFSVSDIAAYCFRGRSYAGVEIANTVYFVSMAAGAYIWFLYIAVKVGTFNNLKRAVVITCAPFAVLCVTILVNPVTNFYFTVDEDLLYHRGPGLYVTWIVEWGYMFAALGTNIRAVLRERRTFRRRELCGYLIFALPIAAAAVCQMLFYGVTSTQVGFMVGMLLAYLNKQHYQVQRDELTGLNNKNAFLSYQDALLLRHEPPELTLFMLDADDFKQINDQHGHLEGDQALKNIADALKASAGALTQNRVLLYRYGGDEFVIAGTNMTQEQIERLTALIEENLTRINAAAGARYRLSISLGYATGVCTGTDSFAALMKEADRNMYRVKREKKAGR